MSRPHLRNLFSEHVRFIKLSIGVEYPCTAYVNVPIFHPAVSPDGFIYGKSYEDIMTQFMDMEFASRDSAHLDAAIMYKNDRVKFDRINETLWAGRKAFYKSDGLLDWSLVFNYPKRMSILRLIEVFASMTIETDYCDMRCCMCFVELKGNAATFLPCKHSECCFSCALEVKGGCPICCAKITSIE